jgi:thiol:disulfide interchange protein
LNKALKPFWFLLLVFGAIVLFSFLYPRGGAERIPWRTDFAAASAESASTNKPLFIYFTADWCEPCQSLRHTTWADANVEKALSNFIPVKIDVDQHRDLVNQYPSEGIPHFVIAKSDGTKLRETVGAYPPTEFIEWLRS